MTVFKCKMCEGTLELHPGDTVAVCDSCGTKQTLPKLDDDRRANLYDRANHFRRSNEYDKAMGIYEQILTEDKTDAEAYWSLVLCRYGIEYVEDPGSHKRIPTVNRAQFTSVFDDDNYKSALRYADAVQREIYESEAQTINEIQKGILAISQKEQPFDIFICYKETDASGRRTQDSVLANDMYHQLTQEGFKVFFARITLEDKLGTAYEPYIFAALNSAKVMVVLGTKPEYFNAVWVKNEWSRYLALVKNSGGKKTLIPAYKDMDPYDLPEEFSHLQAQDMSKLGFMQDLIRGIKKIVSADMPKKTVQETVVMDSGNVSVEPLLKRVFMFLEDGDWQEADAYCEKVLDQDPENARAYLGKLMAELRVREQGQLKNCKHPFDKSSNFHKVLRFADPTLTKTMNDYIAYINQRNENERLTNVYNGAVNAMNSADTEEAYKAAAQAFQSVGEFKDSKKLAEECFDKAECCRKDALYGSAKSQMVGEDSSAYEEAIELFQSISGWKDADEQVYACQKKIEQIKIEEEKAKKARRKFFAIGMPIIAACITLVVVLTTVVIPSYKYNAGMELYNAGKYGEARAQFYAAGGYKDAVNYYRSILSKPQCEVHTEYNGRISTTEYKYDNNGNCVKKVDTAFDGDISTTEYEYDNTGNCVKEVCTGYSGDTSTTEYEYDSNGNCVKEVYANSRDYSSTTEYKYDDNANCVEAVFTGAGGGISTTRYTYDNKGSCIKEVCTGYSGFMNATEYKYDDNGNRVKEVCVYSNDAICETEYTYDNNGNCTIKVYTHTNGNTDTTEYSDFLYFKKP